MSKRTDPCRKRPAEILADLLEGHRQAALEGPAQARKYLERVIDGNKSLPNASKFFVYDLLAEACAKTGAEERRDEAVAQALRYLPFAQEDAPRECKAYLPEIRCFERGIAAAVDGGEFEQALTLCEQAVALGLGRAYEAKAQSIRRLV